MATSLSIHSGVFMKRCVIVCGAKINDYDFVRGYLEDDFYIFCDGGLNHQEQLGVIPDLIVGDFDSHAKPNVDTETIVLPCEKDDTDSVFAVKEAIKRGYSDFLLIGVIGGRFDHSLGNISILLFLDSLGLNGKIIDDYSEMEIVGNVKKHIDGKCRYFSLLNIFGTAKGITINNAKYPLLNGEISCEYQYGISNEVFPNKVAEVSVENGCLLLVKIMKE